MEASMCMIVINMNAIIGIYVQMHWSDTIYWFIPWLLGWNVKEKVNFLSNKIITVAIKAFIEFILNNIDVRMLL